MFKYKTGFCSNGFCEGTKPRSRSGKPIKVCVSIDICKCECHEKIAKMFEMTNTARVAIQNPDYVPYESGIFEFLESYAKVQADVLPSSTKVVMVEEKPVVADDGTAMLGLARSGRQFEPTKRGRAAGQLEDEIRGICNRFLQREWPDQEICTPKFVAQQIFIETDSETVPSVGAIGAAFDRWEKIGFAIVKKGPVRFVSFTVAGMTEGLEALKMKFKQPQGRRLRSAR